MRLPHPVAFFYYLRWFVDVYGKKVITSKMQHNAENACRNRMWQLGFIHGLTVPVVSNQDTG